LGAQMKVKILHCLETVASGGVEQRRLLLARFLDKTQFEQKLICSRALEGFDERLEAAGTQVFSVGKLRKVWNLAYYRRLLKVVRLLRPDIIHGAVFEGVISAIVAGLFFRIPVIIIEETSDPQNRTWRANLLIRIFSWFADYTVGISPSVVGYLRGVGVAERKLRLINNGVMTPRVPTFDEVNALRQTLGISEQDFVVGSVGRLRDFHKRFSDLIKALALIKHEVFNLKLMIVGDGPDREPLEQLARDLGVADRVIFAGYQKDTAPYYACMNVFALASHMEGFGLVVAEAMFHRLPVVVSRVGGMRDIVIEGKTGFLVPRHEPSAFADAIKHLYNNPVVRNEMGEQGYARARDEYGPEAYVSKVQALYQEAIVKKGLKNTD